MDHHHDNGDKDDGDTGKRKRTHGAGERVDVPAGVVHEVWIGARGCSYVVGERQSASRVYKVAVGSVGAVAEERPADN